MTDQKHLTEQLQKLHQDLQQYQPQTALDEESRRLLQQVNQDIERLTRSGAEGETTMQVSLERSLIHFERDHPVLTAILKEMTDLLNKMGI
jgi:hypothetical protein